jgi:Flp pilus assembly pilin Flp
VFARGDLRTRRRAAPHIGSTLAEACRYTARRGQGDRDAKDIPSLEEPGRCCEVDAKAETYSPPRQCAGIVRFPCRGAQLTMMNLVRSFIRDENGEDLIEYGLLAAFVAAVALVTIILDPIGIKGSLVGAFQKAKDALDAQ